MKSPEEEAEELVIAAPAHPGGSWYIHLRRLADPPILLGQHINPSVVQEEAARVRQFVAAVIREARNECEDVRAP